MLGSGHSNDSRGGHSAATEPSGWLHTIPNSFFNAQENGHRSEAHRAPTHVNMSGVGGRRPDAIDAMPDMRGSANDQLGTSRHRAIVGSYNAGDRLGGDASHGRAPMSRQPRIGAVRCAMAIMTELEEMTGDGNHPASPQAIAKSVKRHPDVVAQYLRVMVTMNLASTDSEQVTKGRLYYSEMIAEDLAGIRLHTLASDVVLRRRHGYQRVTVTDKDKQMRSGLFELCRTMPASKLSDAVRALETIQ